MPADFAVAALRAHCRRVAALAGEIARCLRLPPDDVRALEQAALLHHWPADLLEGPALDALVRDIWGFAWPKLFPGRPSASPPAALRAVFDACRARPGGAPEERSALLAEILEMAGFFADRIEFSLFELQTVEQTLNELDWMARDGLYQPSVISALASLPRSRSEDLIEKLRRLPVFPAVALRVLELAWREDTDFSELERLASADQVLAGHVIHAANRALYSAAQPIATIGQAISYIGLDAARRVLMAAVFQPLFASARLHELWQHSLDMGQRVARIAATAGRVDPDEAFLAGLVHDIGRLAFEQLARPDADTYARMLEIGCDPVFAELVLCGADHGACGSEVLRSWAFPPHLIDAVQRHHQPEQTDSPLAAILYAAEFLSGSEEDVFSRLRLRAAEEKLGVAVESLEENEALAPDPLATLLGAA